MMTIEDFKKEAIRAQFTDTEWTERGRHIATLRNFAGASVAAANALAIIQEKKLFRPHKTLKQFCAEECGWSEQHLFRVIKFAKIRASLPAPTNQLVSRESQARELATVPEEQREEVLNEAQKNGEITAESIRQAAGKILPTNENGLRDMGGFPVPRPAQACWSRKGEAEEILKTLRTAKKKVNALDKKDIMWIEVNLGGVLGDLESAINRFRGGVPAHVCAHCQGQHPAKCTACKGRGVISEYFWRQCVPVELREMREKSCR